MVEVHPMNGQVWLICGGRHYNDTETFDGAMSDLMRAYGCPDLVVHGAASGADCLAGKFAERMAISVSAVRADWAKHGKAAGPIRNKEMLEKHSPDLVIAFPGGKGTANMIRQAREAGVTVAEIKLPRAPQHSGNK